MKKLAFLLIIIGLVLAADPISSNMGNNMAYISLPRFRLPIMPPTIPDSVSTNASLAYISLPRFRLPIIPPTIPDSVNTNASLACYVVIHRSDSQVSLPS